MMRVYATQHDSNHYEIQVGRVVWQGEGQWTQLTLPERREIVRLILATDLSLQMALDDCAEVYHVRKD